MSAEKRKPTQGHLTFSQGTLPRRMGGYLMKQTRKKREGRVRQGGQGQPFLREKEKLREKKEGTAKTLTLGQERKLPNQQKKMERQKRRGYERKRKGERKLTRFLSEDPPAKWNGGRGKET